MSYCLYLIAFIVNSLNLPETLYRPDLGCNAYYMYLPVCKAACGILISPTSLHTSLHGNPSSGEICIGGHTQ